VIPRYNSADSSLDFPIGLTRIRWATADESARRSKWKSGSHLN